ncbi:hypothetical protein JCM13210_08850 [Thermaerobacter litoralis]
MAAMGAAPPPAGRLPGSSILRAALSMGSACKAVDLLPAQADGPRGPFPVVVWTGPQGAMRRPEAGCGISRRRDAGLGDHAPPRCGLRGKGAWAILERTERRTAP